MMKKPDCGTAETNIFQASIESERTKKRLPAIVHLLPVIMATHAMREMTMTYAMTGMTSLSLLPSIIAVTNGLPITKEYSAIRRIIEKRIFENRQALVNPTT